MGTDAVTPSKSTQDLIQATRPGFPRGLRVLFVMQDEKSHAPSKKLLEDIGYEGTSRSHRVISCCAVPVQGVVGR